jgi:hypothetical protein
MRLVGHICVCLLCSSRFSFSGKWEPKTAYFISALQRCTDAGAALETFDDLLYPIKIFRCSLCGVIPKEDRVMLCDHCARDMHVDCAIGSGGNVPSAKVYCAQCKRRKERGRPLLGGQCAPLRHISDVIRVEKVRMIDTMMAVCTHTHSNIEGY